MDRLRHLDPDRSAAKHEQPAGHGLHSGHFPVCPDPFERAQPLDRRDHRIRAIRKHDVVGGVAYAVHLDDTPTRQSAGAAKQVNTGLDQPPLLADIGVVRDHEVPPPERRLNVHLCRCGRVVCCMRCLARPQQRLRRNASPIRALATNQLTLDERDMQTTGG
jgi:hypothetical protein